MKNKFILELSRRLLLCAGFEEMKEVLEDYSGFMGEGELKEKPKDVISSLDLPKKKNFKIIVVYFVLIALAFFCILRLDIYTGTSVLYDFAVIHLINISLLFTLITFWVWGKKSAVLSKYVGNNKSLRVTVALTRILPCVLLTGFFVYIVLSFNDVFSFGFLVNYSQSTVAICYGLLLCFVFSAFILFFMFGSEYFVSLTMAFISFCTFMQYKLFLGSISRMDDFIVPYLCILYFIFVIQAVVTVTLNKKLKKVMKE